MTDSHFAAKHLYVRRGNALALQNTFSKPRPVLQVQLNLAELGLSCELHTAHIRSNFSVNPPSAGRTVTTQDVCKIANHTLNARTTRYSRQSQHHADHSDPSFESMGDPGKGSKSVNSDCTAKFFGGGAIMSTEVCNSNLLCFKDSINNWDAISGESSS